MLEGEALCLCVCVCVFVNAETPLVPGMAMYLHAWRLYQIATVFGFLFGLFSFPFPPRNVFILVLFGLCHICLKISSFCTYTLYRSLNWLLLCFHFLCFLSLSYSVLFLLLLIIQRVALDFNVSIKSDASATLATTATSGVIRLLII